MKVVIQRVRSASVTVDNKIISKIGRGLLILVGIGTTDTSADSQLLVSKILQLKLFPDEVNDDWGWKKTLSEANFELLSVSQFTLLANTKKGGKPDFHGAMGAEQSQIMYNDFLLDLKTRYSEDKIFDGAFGKMMDVALVNDGPVTILLDSKDSPQLAPGKQAKLERRVEAEEQAKVKEKKREADKQKDWKRKDSVVEVENKLEEVVLESIPI